MDSSGHISAEESSCGSNEKWNIKGYWIPTEIEDTKFQIYNPEIDAYIYFNWDNNIIIKFAFSTKFSVKL